MAGTVRTVLWRNVALLAAASFIADVSGEMLMAVFPFLLTAQGASGLGLGLVAGVTDGLGHIIKVVGGRLADLRSRKPLVVGGYFLAAVSRIGIALAPVWGLSLAFRAADRIGKGLRTAPRDALLAESAPRASRGRVFGIHRAADTAGALVGASIALGATVLWSASPSSIVFVGALIGLATVLPLLAVRDPRADGEAPVLGHEPRSPLFGRYLGVASLHALGNLSYLFFLIRARDVLGSVAAAMAMYLLFNVLYLVFSYPLGAWTDRVGRRRILAGGYVATGVAVLGLLPGVPLPRVAVGLSFAVLGLAYAAVDGVGRALAADLAGTEARATWIGWYHGTLGAATLVGGVTVGFLYDRAGVGTAFGFAAAAALLAAPLALVWLRGTDAQAG